MARTLTPQDCYALMNSLVKQATGQASITATDTSSFVSAGETVLATGTENVLNSLSLVIGKTLVSSRAYKGQFKLIAAENTGLYSHRLRKISYYSKNALPSGAFNTNLYTNLYNGFTAGQNIDGDGDPQSTKSQWEQNPPIALEMNFGGTSTWQNCLTYYQKQLQTAFRNETEFSRFVTGFVTEHRNDIESQMEAWNRMAVLNKIGAVYDMQDDMPGSVINLTELYNDTFGTEYTSEQLRTTYLKEFLAFFVATFKKMSKRLTERSLNYHWSPTKTIDSVDYEILRHTSFDNQKVMLFNDLFVDAESLVLPEIFHDDYLKMDNYEAVTFWQSQDDRAAVSVTPAITNTSTGVQAAGDAVSLDYVVGMIFDKDALLTDFQLEDAAATPMEARKKYYNVWETYAKNIICDQTENTVLFIMADPVTETDTEG